MSNNDAIISNNGAVLTVSQIIKAVMSSATEAELGSLFINCREEIPARHALEIMGHKQPPTTVQTDNTTDLGVVNKNIASKRLKSMDMKLHWLRCRIAQKKFRHYWQPGPTNLGDYVIKHHAPIYHWEVRGTYLTPISKLDLLRSNNGAVLTVSQIIKALISSSAEAELGALFINCREAIPEQHALEIMGHKQPPTPVHTDNTTAL